MNWVHGGMNSVHGEFVAQNAYILQGFARICKDFARSWEGLATDSGTDELSSWWHELS